MAEFPALPLWTDAYIADTRHLSAAQHGAYFLLLMTAWRTPQNALPDDDVKLARWACMNIRTWAKNKAVIMEFWELGADGLWRQKRLDKERKYVENMRDQRKCAGRASALKRKETGQRAFNPRSSPVPTPTPIPLITSISPNENEGESGAEKPKEKPSKKASGKRAFILPDWIDPQDWKDYEEMRASRGNPLETDRARQLAVNTLEKLRDQGHSPAQVLQQSVFKSWTGLFAIKDQNPASMGQTSIPTKPKMTDEEWNELAGNRS